MDNDFSIIADVLLPLMDEGYRDLVNSEMAIFEEASDGTV